MRTVHRKALLQALAEELPPDTIRFSSKLISINSETLEDSSTATFLHLEDGTVIKAKVHHNNFPLFFYSLLVVLLLQLMI